MGFCLIAHSSLTLHHAMDCSPPGSSIPEIFQARIQERGAMPSSRESLNLHLPHLLHFRQIVYSLSHGGRNDPLEKEMATLAFLLGMTEQMKTGLANPKLQFPQCYSHQSFGKFFADRAPLFPEDPRRHVGHALPLWRFLQRPRTQLLISSSMSLTGRALTKGIFLQWFRKGQ